MAKKVKPVSSAAAEMGRARMKKLKRDGTLREYQQAAARARWGTTGAKKKRKGKA